MSPGFSVLRTIRSLLVVLALAIPGIAQNAVPASSGAAPSEASAIEALQKAVQNPVASLISVPLQNNTNFDYGPYNRTQDVLNIQPVIPIKLSDKWNLITRIIQPIVWQPYPNQNTGGEYGLGDMNPSFFLSPAKPGKLIWGAGPTLVVPTATSTVLGQGKLSLGPSVVLLAQPPHWTIGALINNVWSVAVSGGRPPVNQMSLAVLHQLQHEERLVYHAATNHHGRLASEQRERVDRAVRGRHRADHEAGLPASEPHGPVLWQRYISSRNFVVERAGINRVPVSEAYSRGKEDDDGATTQEARGAAKNSREEVKQMYLNAVETTIDLARGRKEEFGRRRQLGSRLNVNVDSKKDRLGPGAPSFRVSAEGWESGSPRGLTGNSLV